jgi:DNA-binding IclR family transcriptional regulator
MLGRPGGASILELVDATGWKRNTVHAALTTLRKQGFEVAVEVRPSGGRYRIQNAEVL